MSDTTTQQDTFEIVDGGLRIGDRWFPAEVDATDRAMPSLMFELARGGSHHITRRARLKFESGYVLSVVFGTGTYSSNRDFGWGDQKEFVESPTSAEIAVWNDLADVDMVRFEQWGDSVHGWSTPAYVLAGADQLGRGWCPVAGDAWPCEES